jgi:hypothetical protein
LQMNQNKAKAHLPQTSGSFTSVMIKAAFKVARTQVAPSSITKVSYASMPTWVTLATTYPIEAITLLDQPYHYNSIKQNYSQYLKHKERSAIK